MGTIKRIEPNARLSRAVVYNGMVFLAGIGADDLNQDFRSQLENVLAKADRYLAAAGSDKTRILTTEIWIQNVEDFGVLNELWSAWLPSDSMPARATTRADMTVPNLLVELLITAATAE